MSGPSIIRTEFASAEDAADVYGVPRSRIATIRRTLLAQRNAVKDAKRPKRRMKELVVRKRSRKKTQ
jgi:hypothetical protein